VEFTLAVKVGPSVGAGTVLANTVTVSSSTPDPNPANNSAMTATTVNAVLSVEFSGNGSGTVTSTTPDAAINCNNGSSGGCSADYPVGMSVTLVATPDWRSLFGGWSGGVTSSANPVTFTMDGSKAVIATFNLAPLLQVGPAGYPDLQAAYDAAASGAIIQMLSGADVGSLDAYRDVAVTLKGGYASGYMTNTGTTEVTAPLKVDKGRVVIDGIMIR
jgi:hypothetical protein